MPSSPVSPAAPHRVVTRLLVAVVIVALAFAGLGPLPAPHRAEAQAIGLGNRLFVATGSRGVPGALFVASPASGASTFVGNLLVGTLPVGITGLAVHPITRVLYGSTTNASPNLPGRLVTIDTTTAAVTVVGPFNPPGTPTTSCTSGAGGPATMQDLEFRADGTLFGFCNATLFVINPATGQAAPIGSDPYTSTDNLGGGGLAFTPLLNPNGSLWVGARQTLGDIFRVDPTTGRVLQALQLTGGSDNEALASLTTDQNGMLLGAGSGVPATPNLPVPTRLVSINTTTGAISTLGALPNNTDAITLDLALIAPPDPQPENEDNRRTRRNNATRGEDESRTEGDVVGVRCAESEPVPELSRGFIVHPNMVPYAVIGTRDGAQQVLLIHESAKSCTSIHVGDYLEVDGEKQSEELFQGHDIDIKHR
jgi:hypothetical protein